MTSLLAVALAVSMLGVPLGATSAGAMSAGAHRCCARMAGHCPASLQCCAPDQKDRTPLPAPDARAVGTPPPDAGSSSAATVTIPAPLPAPPVALVRSLTAPPLLYLQHSTLLV